MKIGSTVRFADSFLQDIEASATAVGKPLRYAVGIVVAMDDSVATVQWNSARIPQYMAAHFLAIVS